MSQLKERQGLLFSEPSIAETGVWCSLNDGIDPADWAYLCRYIGKLSPREFRVVKKQIVSSPDSLGSRMKRLFDFGQISSVNVPILSFGPSGIGGEYQREV